MMNLVFGVDAEKTGRDSLGTCVHELTNTGDEN